MKDKKFEFLTANFFDLLFLLFLGLKLSGMIGWPWIWIFSPYWVPLVVLGLAVGGAALYMVAKEKKK